MWRVKRGEEREGGRFPGFDSSNCGHDWLLVVLTEMGTARDDSGCRSQTLFYSAEWEFLHVHGVETMGGGGKMRKRKLGGAGGQVIGELVLS